MQELISIELTEEQKKYFDKASYLADTDGYIGGYKYTFNAGPYSVYTSMIHMFPTGNCQYTHQIGYFKYVFNGIENDEVIPRLRAMFSVIKPETIPTLVGFDVDQCYTKKLQEIFGETLMLFPYDSTNGSKMMLGFINFRKLKY